MPTVPYTDNVVPIAGQPQAPQIDPKYLLMAAATMHEQGRLFEPPESWKQTGQVHTPEDDAKLTEFEKDVSEKEASKYEKDDSGRLKVPDDWEAPSGFRGRVMQKGMDIGYPGVARRRTYVK